MIDCEPKTEHISKHPELLKLLEQLETLETGILTHTRPNTKVTIPACRHYETRVDPVTKYAYFIEFDIPNASITSGRFR